jgi:hypothetical protein
LINKELRCVPKETVLGKRIFFELLDRIRKSNPQVFPHEGAESSAEQYSRRLIVWKQIKALQKQQEPRDAGLLFLSLDGEAYWW